ncbi:hypothetical protein BC830DRAFT_761778 [Chytriomyces sp. MP71]|nr:hypothetical protein BC830DRAFT_761778 [Chytriomyces sp. MP71]
MSGFSINIMCMAASLSTQLTALFVHEVNKEAEPSLAFINGSPELQGILRMWFLMGYGIEIPHAVMDRDWMFELLKLSCLLSCNQNLQNAMVSILSVTLHQSIVLEFNAADVNELCGFLTERNPVQPFHSKGVFDFSEWIQKKTGRTMDITGIKSPSLTVSCSGTIRFSGTISNQELMCLFMMLKRCSEP